MTPSPTVITDRGVRTQGLTRVFGTGDAAVHALKGIDLDIASEMTSFTSKQILQQAGTAMLGQANAIPQSVLRLLG